MIPLLRDEFQLLKLIAECEHTTPTAVLARLIYGEAIRKRLFPIREPAAQVEPTPAPEGEREEAAR